jgi:hypothetical protein
MSSESSSGLFKIEPLTGTDNYPAWKFRMEDILRALKLISHTDESYVAPNDTEAKVAWKERDQLALSHIRLRVKDSIIVYVRNAKTAAEAWKILSQTYETKGALAIVLARRRLFRAKCEEGEDVEEFLRKLQGYMTDLTALGSKVEDEEYSITILTALPDSWDSFTAALDTTATKNSQELIARILEHDRRLKAKNGNEAVLTANLKYGKKEERECFYCKKKGHLKKNCRKRKRDESHGSNSTNLATTGPEFTFTLEDNEITLASSASRDAWIGDNATSRHCVNNDRLLINAIETKTHVEGVGPGTSTKSGTVELISKVNGQEIKINLKDVLYLPKLPHNLISLGRIEAGGASLSLKDGTLKVNQPKSGKVLMIGRRLGNHLYEMKVEARRNEVNLSKEPQLPRTIEEWHRAFGHINNDSIKLLAKNGMVSGLEIKEGTTPISDCKDCIEAKSTKFSVPKESHTKYDNIGDLIVSDVWGPSRIVGLRKERFFVTFTDAKTRRTNLYLMQNKSEAIDHFKHYRALIKTQCGARIKRLRVDNGKEYDNRALRRYCAENGINLEFTAPYSSSQNGIAERLNRTLVENTRAMLAHHRTDLSLWPEAVAYACYLKNRSPTRALGTEITPEEAWSGKKPDVSRLREFGSNMWVLTENPKQMASKIEPKSRQYQFMGLSDESRAYRYYRPDIKQVLTTRNGRFTQNNIEEYTTATLDPAEGQLSEGEEIGESTQADKDEPLKKEGGEPAEKAKLTIKIPARKIPEAQNAATANEDITPQAPAPITTEPAAPETKRPTRAAKIPLEPTRCSTRFIKPNKEAVEIIEEILLNSTTTKGEEKEPFSLLEAKGRTDWPKWKSAMDTEMNQLRALGTFELVKLPENRKPISCKWVFRLKRDINGNIEKFKARLVARGFSQIPGIDFLDTYSPVVRQDTLRTLIAIGAKNDMEIHQLDFVGAYLHAKLEEEIYITQPEDQNDGTGRVLKLNKALYGLRQAGRVWNKTLHDFLDKLGYIQLKSDKCVYLKDSDLGRVILAVHVDDILALADSPELMKLAKEELQQGFPIKDLGEVKQLLGLEIFRNRAKRLVTISQSNYIKSIISRFGLENAHTSATPMDPNVKLRAVTENDEEITDVKYQEAIGSLIYAAIGTRPDISYAVQALSQFNTKHTQTHWTAVKRVFRYLKGTANYGITYGGSRHGIELKTYFDNIRLEGFSDADWGANPDDRRSISGYTFLIGNGAVSWSSKKQQTVALSSMEAEYLAISHAAKQAIWMKTLLNELGYPQEGPIQIRADNQSAIAFAKDNTDHSRTKHIDIRHHFIRDCIQDNQISISYVNTNENSADIFTKALPKDKHGYLATSLGIFHA